MQIPNANLRALENLYTMAKAAADAFNDALASEAEKYQCDKTGLGRYVRAVVNDKLDKLRSQEETVAQLVMAFDNPEEEKAA